MKNQKLKTLIATKANLLKSPTEVTILNNDDLIRILGGTNFDGCSSNNCPSNTCGTQNCGTNNCATNTCGTQNCGVKNCNSNT